PVVASINAPGDHHDPPPARCDGQPGNAGSLGNEGSEGSGGMGIGITSFGNGKEGKESFSLGSDGSLGNEGSEGNGGMGIGITSFGNGKEGKERFSLGNAGSLGNEGSEGNGGMGIGITSFGSGNDGNCQSLITSPSRPSTLHDSLVMTMASGPESEAPWVRLAGPSDAYA